MTRRRSSCLGAECFNDPPPELPLAAELRPGADILYFADSGRGGSARPNPGAARVSEDAT